MASWSTQKSVMACNWQKKVTCTYSVWDPTSTTLAEKLESVQRFAAKLYTKHWSDSPTTLITILWTGPPSAPIIPGRKPCYAGALSKMSPSFFYPRPFLHLPISILIFITLVQFVCSLLPELPHFRHHFLYLPVPAVCGTAFQNIWSAYHLHVHLRLLCRTFHPSYHDDFHYFNSDHLIHVCVLIKSYTVSFYFWVSLYFTSIRLLLWLFSCFA